MKVLITGSKEYPMGTNKGDDPAPSGGMEKYIEELVEMLVKDKNLEISVITRKFSGCLAYEKKNNLTIYRVPYLKGFLLRNPTFNILAAIKSLRIDYDVILSNGEISSILELAVSKMRRKPIVVISHGDASDQPQYNFVLRRTLVLMNHILCKYSDIYVTHAPHQAEKYTKKYKTILPGVDFRTFRKIPSSEATKLKKELVVEGKKVIVYTGRIISVKGLEYLIDAVSKLDSSYACVFVGDGPHMDKYEKLCSASPCKCVFTGFCENVNRYLSIADVFVLPSLSESLSYSMIEAAYMKVPIIVTDLSILPGECGYIVPKKDSAAITEAIVSVFEDKKGTDKKVLEAYKFSKKFDWNRAGDKFVEILEAVCERQ